VHYIAISFVQIKLTWKVDGSLTSPAVKDGHIFHLSLMRKMLNFLIKKERIEEV
jgi:hypothetical protein